MYLRAVAPLVDATLDTLDDATLPAAKWVLELMDAKDDLEAPTDIKISTKSITAFKEWTVKPFITKTSSNT